jgi:arylsulfatase A-like enzyme
LIIADDVSFNRLGVNGSKYGNIPNFDQIPVEGVVFKNTFSNNPKCAPFRPSLLTGRYFWQMEKAVVHCSLML